MTKPMTPDHNLPLWPGAAVVYERCYRINATLCAIAYADSQYGRRKRGRVRLPYAPPEEVSECVERLDRGDEEWLKAYVAKHLNMVLPRTVLSS